MKRKSSWSYSFRDDYSSESDMDESAAAKPPKLAPPPARRLSFTETDRLIAEAEDEDVPDVSDVIDIGQVEEPEGLKFVETPFTIARRVAAIRKRAHEGAEENDADGAKLPPKRLVKSKSSKKKTPLKSEAALEPAVSLNNSHGVSKGSSPASALQPVRKPVSTPVTTKTITKPLAAPASASHTFQQTIAFPAIKPSVREGSAATPAQPAARQERSLKISSSPSPALRAPSSRSHECATLPWRAPPLTSKPVRSFPPAQRDHFSSLQDSFASTAPSTTQKPTPNDKLQQYAYRAPDQPATPSRVIYHEVPILRPTPVRPQPRAQPTYTASSPATSPAVISPGQAQLYESPLASARTSYNRAPSPFFHPSPPHDAISSHSRTSAAFPRAPSPPPPPRPPPPPTAASTTWSTLPTRSRPTLIPKPSAYGSAFSDVSSSPFSSTVARAKFTLPLKLPTPTPTPRSTQTQTLKLQSSGGGKHRPIKKFRPVESTRDFKARARVEKNGGRVSVETSGGGKFRVGGGGARGGAVDDLLLEQSTAEGEGDEGERERIGEVEEVERVAFGAAVRSVKAVKVHSLKQTHQLPSSTFERSRSGAFGDFKW